MDDLIVGSSGSIDEITSDISYPFFSFNLDSKDDGSISEDIAAGNSRHNLFIWDWDDTLFPTWSFRTHQEQKDPLFVAKLRTFVSFAEEIFEALIALYGASSIVIVTNSAADWIDDCLSTATVRSIYSHFRSLLKNHGIATISASDPLITKKHPNSPEKWKEVAFGKLFAEHFDEAPVGAIRCITSIGDSLCEYNASDRASKWLRRRVLHRLRLRPHPSIDDLIEQFKEIAAMVEDFASSDGIEIDFSSPSSPSSGSSLCASPCTPTPVP